MILPKHFLDESSVDSRWIDGPFYNLKMLSAKTKGKRFEEIAEFIFGLRFKLAKKHTKQTPKQSMGQYFTTNAETILSEFETFVAGKTIVDPFAGGWDLLDWADQNGALSVTGYDIEPKTPNTIYKDSLLLPTDYSGKLVLTNPPYLSANKSKGKYKDIYKMESKRSL